jgi:peptide/nickel transport system ATP-binding protein
MSALFITHDLALAADYCDRIVVMHAGQVVEAAPTRAVFHQSRHPYTQRLLSSTPRADTQLQQLAPVPGSLPDLKRSDLPACRFAERCERAQGRCRQEAPPLQGTGQHQVACWHPLSESQVVVASDGV